MVPASTVDRHCDGQGLYLLVQPTGTRSWVQRLVVRGRRRELGLGSISLVSLAEAREKALAYRKLAREGGDRLAARRRAVGVPTFADAARRVLEQKRPGWRSRKHAQQWWATLTSFAFPQLGKLPVFGVKYFCRWWRWFRQMRVCSDPPLRRRRWWPPRVTTSSAGWP